MNSNTRGYLLAAVIAALLTLVLDRLVDADYGRRNYEALTEMVYSRAGESFARSPVLPGGQALQPLEKGVVVRGALLASLSPGPDGAAQAGRELVNPFAADEALALERGRELYAIYCVVCHDAQGQGRGPAVARGMLPPPSLSGARALGMSDGEMFHVLTLGQGNMASYAEQLDPLERWQVILHVRSLQAR